MASKQVARLWSVKVLRSDANGDSIAVAQVDLTKPVELAAKIGTTVPSSLVVQGGRLLFDPNALADRMPINRVASVLTGVSIYGTALLVSQKYADEAQSIMDREDAGL